MPVLSIKIDNTGDSISNGAGHDNNVSKSNVDTIDTPSSSKTGTPITRSTSTSNDDVPNDDDHADVDEKSSSSSPGLKGTSINAKTNTITPPEKSSSQSVSQQLIPGEGSNSATNIAATAVQKTPSPTPSGIINGNVASIGNMESFKTPNNQGKFDDQDCSDDVEEEDVDSDEDEEDEEQDAGSNLRVYGKYIIDPENPMASWKGDPWDAEEVRI
jgi:hypothetical protein